jgi:hypothetical protein
MQASLLYNLLWIDAVPVCVLIERGPPAIISGVQLETS